MNKRALLNAVVRNIMTKRAAQEDKGSTKPQAKTSPLPVPPALDPKLGDKPSALTDNGGIFDLLADRYGVRPELKESPDSSDVMEYNHPDIGDLTYGFTDKPFDFWGNSFREQLRNGIAIRSAAKLYPTLSRNYKDFQEAAKRFGRYRQLQQQNQGTLKNSLQFAPWVHDNAPQVYRKLMNAPKKNRDKALQILKWQVNNRRNQNNGYV